MTAARILKPGSTIGMLGGGQLGRMAAQAAGRLGYHVHVYAQDEGEPAIEVSRQATIAAWDDRAALVRFAESVDVVTLEFENVPVEAVALLAELKSVHPGVAALSIAQDRIAEKSFMGDLGIETAPWAAVRSSGELQAATAAVGMPAILKSARLGYDGKGQVRITDADVAEAAWSSLGRVPSVLEGMVAFDCEISLVLARGQDGAMEAYPTVQNIHDSGILAETIAPAPIDATISNEADRIARLIADALDYVGVLSVEFFVCGRNLLVNEIAPRPHNSGHWTIDACYVSQFEQQIRAVAGLPLGPTARHSNAVMLNLIGEAALDWQTYLADPGARLHLYGKREIRAGRKMGHVTRLSPLLVR